ncbi:MAG: sugar ABC transporter permease [Chloroflexota bacterium]|nr:sugar ABC transporter permease [Chloroflexota bacterium]
MPLAYFLRTALYEQCSAFSLQLVHNWYEIHPSRLHTGDDTMNTLLPFIVGAIGALAGAALFARSFRGKQRAVVGTAIGAGAGAIGALLLMLPLDFCMFDPERKTADVIFGGILIVVGFALVTLPTRALALRFLLPRPTIMRGESGAGAYRGAVLPWLLLAPTLIVLALFLYYPSLDTFRLSTLLSRLGAPRTAFVCVDNYTRLAVDSDYINSLIITLAMSAAIVVIGLTLSLGIATLAFQPIKGAKIYRTLLIWPYAISPAVAGVIFLLLFNPTGGIINYFLDGVFGFKIGWLNVPAVAPWAVIIASIWKSIGYNVLFYLAGLQNVPNDLLEASAIDGATAWQRFIRIVVPMLSPITFFLVITNMTYAFFDTFGTIDYLTGGGPLSSTTTMMYRIYQVGIQNNDLGKAAAESILLFVIVIGLTALQFRTSERQVTYGA